MKNNTPLTESSLTQKKRAWEVQEKLPIRISRYLLEKAYENGLVTFRNKHDGIAVHIGEHWFYCVSEPDKKISDFKKDRLLREAYMAINSEPINAATYDEATECLYYMHYLQEQLSEKGVDYTRGNLLANIECPHCGHKYYGSAYRTEIYEWLGKCAKCGKEFLMHLPTAPFVIVFLDDYDNSMFLDSFSLDEDDVYEAVSYYALQTPEEFVKKHLELSESPDSMWYGVFEEGHLVCSGACDPYDAEIFVSNMETAEEIQKYYKKYTAGLYDFNLDI